LLLPIEGILTVMSLFVVAEGVSRTGALDYYMGLVLGKPKTIAGAQLRLMLPIATISAFLNNTPIVAVGIPLTLRWAKSIQVPPQQLLIPLSYATILGGTCTLVGTSTNIVVNGKLKEDYPDEPAGQIQLFDLAKYGVPNALIGLAYMLACAPFLLPFGGGTTAAEVEDLLLGARVTPWSPSAGRTVKRSGLNDAGGIYLVNVRRGATGNVHRAVSKDFVVSVGDELYFTGRVEDFSSFCDKHGLEIVTTDTTKMMDHTDDNIPASSTDRLCDLGTTVESVFDSDEVDRLRAVNRLSDYISYRQDYDIDSPTTRVIITPDTAHSEGAVLIAIDTIHRVGLLMDISKTLFEHGLQIRHSEAEVISDRSLSIWRCTSLEPIVIPDYREVWESLDALLVTSDASPVKMQVGLQVIRAVIPKGSGLVGKHAAAVKFRERYGAGIVAYQKNGKNTSIEVAFSAGDLLVLQANEGSPLLAHPPLDFYTEKKTLFSKRSCVPADEDDIEHDAGNQRVWKDLQVLSSANEHSHVLLRDTPSGEFLTAFRVEKGSSLIGRTVLESGYSRLPGVVLVGVERSVAERHKGKDASVLSMDAEGGTTVALTLEDPLTADDALWYSGSAEAIGDLKRVRGMELYQEDHIKKTCVGLTDRRLVQAVVARSSPLVGRAVADVRFRTKYGGVVIAIQRGRDRIRDHPAEVVLRTGDVLLIETGRSFAEKNSTNCYVFALVSEVEGSSPPRPQLFLLCVALIGASLAIAAVELRSLLITATIVGIVMVSLGVVTQQEARDAMQWDLFVVVASAVGVGNAMVNSGVAKGFATVLVDVGKKASIGGAYS
jgi:di/tricarboxylate transporter